MGFNGWFGGTFVAFRPGLFPVIPELAGEFTLPEPIGIIATPSQEELGRVSLLVREIGDSCGSVYTRARDHTSAETVNEALSMLTDCASLIALGGGAAIGLAKALAVLGNRPYAAYPTTFSGSEMTDIYGIVEEHAKIVRRDGRARAAAVLYDPELFRSLSPHVMRASLFNCLSHCIELAWLRAVPPAAILAAEESCRLIGAGSDLGDSNNMSDSLGDLVTAGWLGGMALSMAGVGVHHTICHVLGGATGVPHGVLHALVLPPVMLLNRNAGQDLQQLFVSHLWPQAVDTPYEAITKLRRRWGLPATLREISSANVDPAEITSRVLALPATSRNLLPVEYGALRECIEQVMSGP